MPPCGGKLLSDVHVAVDDDRANDRPMDLADLDVRISCFHIDVLRGGVFRLAGSFALARASHPANSDVVRSSLVLSHAICCYSNVKYCGGS